MSDTDPLMQLADALLAGLVAGVPTAQFTAQWKDDALAELSDATLETTQVWVVDTSESLLPANDGIPIEEFGLLIVVQRKMLAGEDWPTKCRELSALVSAITRYCRRTSLIEASCVRTVRNPARNLDDYHRLDRFYAEIQTTWHRTLDDD